MTTRARYISHLIAGGTVFALLVLSSQLFIEFLVEAPEGESIPDPIVISLLYALFGTLAVAIPLLLVDHMSKPLPPNIQPLALLPVVLLTLTIWSLAFGQSSSLLVFFQFVYWAALWGRRLLPKSRREAFWGSSESGVELHAN